ncbi:MAG: glycerol-3-phosphate 1-O-acyltransferase PlsY [Deltaproteobacteria bacterium]|nr:glycerol-3-phosphate 1-O-acyltransferase PlsY [Deltaproteobacteria bacterium]
MIRAILLWVMAYLLGSVPVGVIVAEWFNSDDPRTMGSGNIGATNVARTAGGEAGLVTLAGDCLKGFLAVIIARIFGAGDGVAALTGLAAFLGHLYPIFLDFKGGKGVATALGVFIALSPLASLLALIVFAVGAVWSRYVSLGSLAAAITMPVFLSQMDKGWKIVYTALIMTGFIIYRHRDNILRLCQGEESRFLEDMHPDCTDPAPDTDTDTDAEDTNKNS